VADDISNAFNGPNPPYYARIDSVARCVKVRWPNMPTAVRQRPRKLALSYRWRWLDNAVANYSGPISAGGESPATYLIAEQAAARARGLGVIFGINALDGGDGSSRILGTFGPYWQMTAAETETAGRVLLPQTCLFANWAFSPLWRGTDPRPAAQIAGIVGYDKRPDVRAAWARLRALADTLPTMACWRRP
jgi:hypothetical protein